MYYYYSIHHYSSFITANEMPAQQYIVQETQTVFIIMVMMERTKSDYRLKLTEWKCRRAPLLPSEDLDVSGAA